MFFKVIHVVGRIIISSSSMLYSKGQYFFSIKVQILNFYTCSQTGSLIISQLFCGSTKAALGHI